MGYYLMIKEAVELGVKYLCKCGDYKDPIAYKGSGVFWRKIINKHQPTIKTTILGYYETKEELRAAGEFYSIKFNVVEDRSWANLMPELGDGGPTVTGKIYAYNPITLQRKLLLNESEIPKGWCRGQPPRGPRDPKITAKIVAAQKGQKRSEETKERMRNAIRKPRSRVKCIHCNRLITPQNLLRHMEKTHGKEIR